MFANLLVFLSNDDLEYDFQVSDFGLAKIFSDTNPSVTHISTRVMGTFG
jgi:hypothetical protein